MKTKKPIQLIKGGKKRLAADCKVSEVTVWRAMRWKDDTPLQRLVRDRAKRLGLIKMF